MVSHRPGISSVRRHLLMATGVDACGVPDLVGDCRREPDLRGHERRRRDLLALGADLERRGSDAGQRHLSRQHHRADLLRSGRGGCSRFGRRHVGVGHGRGRIGFWNRVCQRALHRRLAGHQHALAGVPPCGSSTSSPAPPAAAAPTAPTPPTSAPASPPAAIYFSPFSSTDSRTWLQLGDQSVATVYSDQWESQCTLPRLAYTAALAKLAPGQTIGTLAGWSAGRLGPIDFLANATPTQEQQLNYIILIDPGNESDLSGCDRFMDAGDLLAGWLRANPDAHLAVISSSVISQQNNSQGYPGDLLQRDSQSGRRVRPGFAIPRAHV
jgi:hypothetical protein